MRYPSGCSTATSSSPRRRGCSRRRTSSQQSKAPAWHRHETPSLPDAEPPTAPAPPIPSVSPSGARLCLVPRPAARHSALAPQQRSRSRRCYMRTPGLISPRTRTQPHRRRSWRSGASALGMRLAARAASCIAGSRSTGAGWRRRRRPPTSPRALTSESRATLRRVRSSRATARRGACSPPSGQTLTPQLCNFLVFACVCVFDIRSCEWPLSGRV